MGWTKEEFIRFCSKAGVRPENALKEGKIDMRSPAVKAKHTADRVKGADKCNERRKKRETKERQNAYRNIIEGMQNSIGKSDQAVDMAKEVCKQDNDMDTVAPRYRIKITGYRVRPIDPDNHGAGCKSLIDGIVKSKLISGDDWKTLAVEFAQVKVKTWGLEDTLIQIDFPQETSLDPVE